MSQYVKVNLNSFIYFRLTYFGEYIYAKYFVDRKTAPCTLHQDDHGIIRMQLWEFMQIFGDSIYVGSKNVIEPNSIVVDGGELCEDISKALIG